MNHISLNNNFKLSFEKLPHTIRVIILKNDEECVCGKETLKNLLSFTEDNKEHLFKGRLQLFKSDGKIDIQVKKEFIGTVSHEVFKKALNKLH
ncbi:hypothetical protein [Pedobacter sp.]|uniref:hypothetical protein n=1 Tax=Pedobacter sp. TaxID=1411316 RepID=UPI003BAC6C52